MSLLSWLEEEKEFPKVYWKEKGSLQAIAAAGATEICRALPLAPTQLYFGGMSFGSQSKDSLWSALPGPFFFAPKTLRSEFEPEDPGLIPNPIQISHALDLSVWKLCVEKALKQIEAKEFDKVVLARRTTCIYQDLVNPFALLRALQSFTPYCTLFLFQLSPNCSFVGATPEYLYRREDNILKADALAGTAPLGQSQDLMRDKEQREFGHVKTFLQERLSPLCLKWGWNGEDQIISTSRMHHLYNCFSGMLQGGDDATLLSLLHPTPAVAGFPQDKALAYLQREEPLDRGWYAAPLGWIGPESARFVVAIRSAFIQGKELHAFAATGIVRGSDAEKEWDELNLKISHFTKV